MITKDEPRILVIVRELLKAGANARLTSGFGGAPFHDAAQFGHTKVMAILLPLAPEMMTQVARDGHNPLSCAAQEGRADAVSLILSAGATQSTEV